MNIPKERIERPGNVSKEAASRKPVEVERDIGGALPEADAPLFRVSFPWVARSVVSASERWTRRSITCVPRWRPVVRAVSRRQPVRAGVPKLTATHVKELIDEVREKSEDAVAPMTGLLAEAA